MQGQGQCVIDMCCAMALFCPSDSDSHGNITLEDDKKTKMVHKCCPACSGLPGLCSKEHFQAWHSQ